MAPNQRPLAFITGASSGIGQALALHACQQGYNVALVARRGDQMSQWAHAQGLEPGRYRVFVADVSRIESIVEAGQQCMAQWGVPDVVIANAGLSIGVDTAERADLDDLAYVHAVNTVGPAATFQPFIRAMEQRGRGTLVAVASVAGVRGLPGHGAYCASKAALISYAESLRVELRSSGIKVVTLMPGYIDTPLTQRNRYPMPFLMDAPTFARKAWAAIEAGRRRKIIPWQMAWVAAVLQMLPSAWFDRLLANMPRKHRGR